MSLTGGQQEVGVAASFETWDYHENSSSALTDQIVQPVPATGKTIYVTDIICSTGAATAWNIFFEQGVRTVLGPWYLEAVAGRGFALHFKSPRKMMPGVSLTLTTSAAIAHSIEVHGFIGDA